MRTPVNICSSYLIIYELDALIHAKNYLLRIIFWHWKDVAGASQNILLFISSSIELTKWCTLAHSLVFLPNPNKCYRLITLVFVCCPRLKLYPEPFIYSNQIVGCDKIIFSGLPRSQVASETQRKLNTIQYKAET